MNLIPWRSKQREGTAAETPPLAMLRNEMDRLFDTFIREPFGALEWPFSGPGKWSPAVDVTESDQEVIVQAELPGIDAKDLDVTLTGTQLVLTGEKKESAEKSGKGYARSEIHFGSFRRTVQLPEGIDPENVEAHYANGILTLRLRKSHASAPKRIEVKVKN
jgi:HSP20 family protein